MKHRASHHCVPANGKNPFDNFINDFFGGLDIVFGKDMPNPPHRTARANVLEDDGAFHIELVAPGRDKADFSVKLDGDTLSITAENRKEKDEDSGTYRRREFRHAALRRDFTLPKNTDRDGISAKYENGILTVSVPKVAEEETSKDIEIL